MYNKIKLYQGRDFGERINITFEFLKQNWKPIAKNLAYFIPIYILSSIPIGMLQSASNSIYNGGLNSHLILSMILAFAAMLVVSCAGMITTLFVIGYVAEYSETENEIVDTSRVWKLVRTCFWGSFGGSILITIAIFIGFIFCVIPGIWLSVCFSIAIPAYVVEKNKKQYKGIIDCIGESFDLVKKNWFDAAIYLFIISMLLFVISLVFVFPLSILTGISGTVFFASTETVNLISIAYNSVSFITSLIYSCVFGIAISILYFDFKEKQYGLSIHDKINNIGKR